MDDRFYMSKLDEEFHPDDPYAPRRIFYVDVSGTSNQDVASYLIKAMKESPNGD